MSTSAPSTEPSPPPAKTPFQFSLRHLLAVPVWLALLFASIAWAGGLGAALFIFLSAIVAAIVVRSVRWVICTWILAACAGLLMLPLGESRGAARRCQCCNNLKQIALALHNYHETYGSFPPAYVTDAEGRPLYSWRVLILPFMESRPLFGQFRFDEPWDSPNNIQVSRFPYDPFCCPSDEQHATNLASAMTNYVVVVGPGTIWPGADSRSFGDVSDGTSNTILVVEVRNSGIHWAEPRDLHVDQMPPGINAAAGQGISIDHPDGVNVALVDGSVRFLPSTTPPEQIRAMLSIAGGEEISRDP
jgi:prepilin-type processing-associated H-X9-DG protein